MKVRYFDHAATTPIRPEVLKEMMPFLSSEYGNPSSLYSIGRSSKKAIDRARKQIAEHINADSDEIFFTSCGSESDNLAIKGIMFANQAKGKHMITSRIEHPAVLNTCKWLEKNGFTVTFVDVDNDGFLNLEQLKKSIQKDTVLISIMFANNEVGTIQDIEEIGKIARAHNIIFHTDAVQAFGNLEIDVERMNIDAMSMSGHKIYAPKGVGALYIRKSIKFEQIQHGGHQEKGKRAGTENVASIVGMGVATELIYRDIEKYNNKLTELRNYYIDEVKKNIDNVRINGAYEDYNRDNASNDEIYGRNNIENLRIIDMYEKNRSADAMTTDIYENNHRASFSKVKKMKRLPGNSNISFMGVDASELLLNLDMYDICASAGSACTSGSMEPSHVLLAMGKTEEEAQSALRATFGLDNTMEDVDYLVDAIKRSIMKLRR